MLKKFRPSLLLLLLSSLIILGVLWFAFAPNDGIIVYRKDGQSTTPSQSAEITKTVLSDQLLVSRIAEPGMDTNVRLCDMAVYGKITDISFCTIDASSGKVYYNESLPKGGSVPAVAYTKYTVQVTDVWMGELGSEKTIEYFEMGNLDTVVTKPKEAVEVVLFLNKRAFGYVSVDSEHSIFTVQNGLVYSYSNRPALCQFDDKNLSTLMLATHDAAKNRFEKDIKCNIVVR